MNDDPLRALDDKPLARLAAWCEQASADYAAHYGVERTDDWALLKLCEEFGELSAAYIALTGRARKAGDRAALRSEFADVLGQLLALAHRLDIDLDEALTRKWLRRAADEPEDR